MNKDIELTFLTKRYLEYKHESHFMYFFVGKYSGEKIDFNQAEVSEVKVLSRDELNERIQGGEIFNGKLLPIIREIWDGKIKVNFKSS